MKKGQILTGRVIRLDFPNKGVVETAEGECTVKNTLPGQRITLMINKIKHGKAEGRLLSVEEKSEAETASPCPHFGACGGCNVLTLPYAEQLRIKAGQVKKLLDSVLDRQEGGYRFEGIKASPQELAYRNKMEFSFGDEEKGGPLSLGMHKRNSFYDVVSVGECQIVDEDYRRILRFTRDYFAAAKLPFYHRLKHEGYLRHLLVRKAAGTQEILVALVTTSQEAVDLTGWKDGILGLPLIGRIQGILHIINDSVADAVKSDKTEILFGKDWFCEEILGLRFKISVFSFFQTNSLGAEVLYETVREFVGEVDAGGSDGRGSGDRESVDEGNVDARSVDRGKKDKGKAIIFDLYSGTGTIAQMMAPVAAKVIGVEIVPEAVRMARENAELNGLHNCEFIAGDVLKVLDEIGERPDFIILDPPRDGVHPKALRKVIDYGVERLVYISCKPTSLVRDLAELLAAGYGVERAVAVDMFPGTGNIETVCLLSRKP